MLDGFKKFILRGNVVDMAVGVVIGAAFGAVVTELTKAFLTPLIALLVGKPDYSNLKFTVRATTFPVGDFINACISFVLIAAAVYFFVVVPINWLIARMHKGDKPIHNDKQITMPQNFTLISAKIPLLICAAPVPNPISPPPNPPPPRSPKRHSPA